MIRRKHILVFLISMLFAASTLTAFVMLRKESRIIGSMSRDNAWIVVKAYEEHNAATHALRQATLEGTDTSLREAKKRLDIVWSRLNLLQNSPNAESIRQLASFGPYSTQTRTHLQNLDDVTVSISELRSARAQVEIDEFSKDAFYIKILTQDVIQGMLSLETPVKMFLHNQWVVWALAGSILFGVLLIIILVLNLRDLSRASQEAEHSRLVAEKANRSKDEFLANMSHELRTPLNAIIGFSDFALLKPFGPINDQYQQYLKDIRSAGQTLLSIVDGLLNVARLSAGRIEPEPTRFNTRDLVEECTHLLEPVAEPKNIKLEVKHDLPNDHMIRTDRNFIYSILINLLTNAVKYSANDTIVHVQTSRALTGGIRFEVRDRGPGIPDEEKQRILEPFERLNSDFADAADGFGLGLYLVKSYTESLGGTFQILNNPGGGTVARITLPSADKPTLPAIPVPAQLAKVAEKRREQVS